MKEVRARKLPLEISTSWWKCLGRFRPAAPQGASGGGQVHFGGRLVEMPPVSSPKFRPAGRRPFHSFRKLGPSAREFRPVHELVNPEVLKEVYRGSFKYPVQRLLQVPCTEAPSSTATLFTRSHQPCVASVRLQPISFCGNRQPATCW
jgi:hypothetical protein